MDPKRLSTDCRRSAGFHGAAARTDPDDGWNALREAGLDIEIQPAHVNEDVEPGEVPEAYVRRVAEAKGRAIPISTD